MNAFQIAKGIEWFYKNKELTFEKNINDYVAENMSWSSLVNQIYMEMEK